MDYLSLLEQWRKRREKILAMLDRGMTKADIARKLRITPQRVGQITKRKANP